MGEVDPPNPEIQKKERETARFPYVDFDFASREKTFTTKSCRPRKPSSRARESSCSHTHKTTEQGVQLSGQLVRTP